MATTDYTIPGEPDLETIDININVGPQHPATHGVFRMVLTVDGELVTDVDPVIGYMHRGNEKLPENCDYRQVIGYHDRTDYLAQFNTEHCFVEAVEKLTGITPTERSQYIRVILAELNRITSHLMFFGAFSTDVGIFGTAFMYAFRDREYVQDFFEEITGERLMYNYFRPGGLAWDVPDNFRERCTQIIEQINSGLKDLEGLLVDNEIVLTRCRGLSRVSIEDAINWGLSGPLLRATGLEYDLRKAEPYSIYDRFDFDVVVGKGEVGTVGDCWDRYWVRVEEMRQCIRIVRQALDQLPPDGDVHAAVPKKVRPPKGEIHFRAENPKGDLGFYIVSDGSPKPYRVKMRSPAFCNLAVINEIARGWMISDVIAVLGSLDIVLGEIDR